MTTPNTTTATDTYTLILQPLIKTVIIFVAGFLVKWGLDQKAAELAASAVVIGGGAAIATYVRSYYDRRRLLNTPAPAESAANVGTSRGNGRQILGLLAAISLLTSGCAATTPEQRLAVAQQTYISTADVVRAAITGKQIADPNVIRAVLAADNQADALLRKARERQVMGLTDQIDFWVDEALAALARIQQIQQQSRKERVSWTQPQLLPSPYQHPARSASYSAWPRKSVAALA
ncbi:MAG TPA: hypothetical protein VF624_14990 [Tepidisphaeraceae bacterium]|jgi:hypothetical protein